MAMLLVLQCEVRWIESQEGVFWKSGAKFVGTRTSEQQQQTENCFLFSLYILTIILIMSDVFSNQLVICIVV